jgi:crotonobetainyl-CoA:carnitine CoA-transferase CaiB-like acyl-CoA transferase
MDRAVRQPNFGGSAADRQWNLAASQALFFEAYKSRMTIDVNALPVYMIPASAPQGGPPHREREDRLVADLQHTPADRDGPLAGLKVLDLTEHMAGPFCTMILADMGAEVVKLERPGRGDSVRAWGDGSERNPYFRYINRNKKGITLDYKQPAGRALFLRLVEGIDVMVENYRPTVMPRAGLGFDTLHEVNPRLIYAQLSGLGYDGPYAGRGGFDLIAQGMGGIMHVTGEPDGPPISVGLPICDLGTGMWAVQGILGALYERQRTGKGRLVECSLLETAIGFSSWTSAQWLADHEEPTRQGSRHRQNAPYQRMQTKDGYLMVGAAGEAIWARCAAALGHPEWSEDPRFATNERRMQNRAALEAEMEVVLTTATSDHWVEVLEAAGVPCGPVYNYAQLFADPQVRHRGLVQYASDPELGEVPHIRTPIKIGQGVRVRTVAPKLGQHNAEIFGRLGVSEAEVNQLCAKGVM